MWSPLFSKRFLYSGVSSRLGFVAGSVQSVFPLPRKTWGHVVEVSSVWNLETILAVSWVISKCLSCCCFPPERRCSVLVSGELVLLLLPFFSRTSFGLGLLSSRLPAASASITALDREAVIKGKLGGLGMTGFTFACVRAYFTGCRLKCPLACVPRTASESISGFSCRDSSGSSSSVPIFLFNSEQKLERVILTWDSH